jgi:hypothetical protein
MLARIAAQLMTAKQQRRRQKRTRPEQGFDFSMKQYPVSFQGNRIFFTFFSNIY